MEIAFEFTVWQKLLIILYGIVKYIVQNRFNSVIYIVQNPKGLLDRIKDFDAMLT